LNKYFSAAFILLVSFIIVAVLVSPKIGFNNIINHRSPIARIDSLGFLDINNSHYPVFNKIMIWLTQFGREIFWPIALLLLFFLGGWTGKKTAVVIAISMLVLIPLAVLTKDIVARPRPEIPQADFLIAADKEFSFPSGHALIVSAGAAGALILFRNTPKQFIVSIILATEAALVCLSRVYVGGHYPLDVIGGILLGVGVSLIFIGMQKQIETVMKPVMDKLRKTKPQTLNRS
jgi:membrane-associated phospholipid phosphatase